MTVPISLSIVIPVYNSEKTIEKLADELIEKLEHLYRLEIILVNDRSQDRSEEACIRLFNRYENVVCFFSLSRNVGEHNAVMAGLNQTTGDYVVIMDDDFQNPVTEVSKLVEAAQTSDFDVVYSYYDEKKHSCLRNFASWLNDRVATIVLKKPVDLYLSSFKLIRRFLVEEITKSQTPFPYIDGLILQCTDRIGRVKVMHAERKEGRSGYTFKKLVSLWLNMFTSFSIIPLRVSTILGFILSSLGLVYGFLSILERLLHPELPPGYSTLIVVLCISTGIQLLVLGMVGEYVGRIFLSLNSKPQYTVKSVYEKKPRRNV